MYVCMYTSLLWFEFYTSPEAHVFKAWSPVQQVCVCMSVCLSVSGDSESLQSNVVEQCATCFPEL